MAYRLATDGQIARYQLAVGSQAVGVGSGLPDAVSLAASPNPSHAAPRLRYTLPAAARARLEVLDVQGRIVRTVLDEAQAAGAHEVRWDLRDASGAPVAAGLYWARLEAGGQRRLARLNVLR